MTSEKLKELRRTYETCKHLMPLEAEFDGDGMVIGDYLARTEDFEGYRDVAKLIVDAVNALPELLDIAESR